jgi:multidrug resistance efflux pump
MIKRLIPLVVILAIGGGIYWYSTRPITSLTLTGTVTTHEIVVSPQIGGRIEKLLVNEGDTVTKDQLVAVLAPAELMQERAYYDAGVEGAGSQVAESEAALRLQERQTTDQIKQAEANLAAAEAQQMAAVADLENAKLELDRSRSLSQKGVEPPQRFDQARTSYDATGARLDALKKQVESQRSAVALAHANAEQVAVRRSQVQSTLQQQQAANAQRAKAEVRLAYAEVRAPIDGIVDVRAVRVGEVVNPGQPIVTLINPDDLWVRADIEETYIDRVRLGDKMTIRLPSGETREGTVFYRGVDAAFATQRDVSRTKRDIKTFEVRLRADNTDRRLAVGMTAYVLLPLNGK